MLLSGLQNLPEDVVGRSCEKYFVYIDATIKNAFHRLRTYNGLSKTRFYYLQRV